MTAVRITITKLERDPRGFFTARVTAEGEAIVVDNRIGPWTAPVDPDADHGSNKVTRREVLPEVAARLRDRVRAYQRGETLTEECDVEIKRAPRRTFRAPEPAPAPVLTAAERIAERMAGAGAAAVKEAA